jgi:hypothetical protein
MHGRTLLLLLALAVAGPAQVCGDCDLNGAATTVVDALTAAQIAASLITPAPTQQYVCDVTGDGAVSILDALRQAQTAAAVPGVSLSCNNPPTCLLLSPPVGTLTTHFTASAQVDDADGDPVTVTFEYSTDGGQAWFPLWADPSSATTNPTPGVLVPATVDLDVALGLSAGCGWNGAIDLRVRVDDEHVQVTCLQAGFTMASSSVSTYAGLPVSATSVVFVIDRSTIMGLPQPWELPGGPVAASSWQAEQIAFEHALNCLDPATQFGVILYHASFVMWRGNLEPATAINRASAIAWVQGQLALGGCTWTPPVSAAINIGGGPPDQVILSWGQGPNEGYSSVFGVTTTCAGQSRIDTVHMATLSHSALWVLDVARDMAALNGGFFLP